MDEVVGVDKLCFDFGQEPILREVSFSFSGRGMLGILGPNGAGKTTLLNLLEGLSRPTGGVVRLFGRALGEGPYPRRRTGVVLQKECAFEAIQVGEYAELFATLYQVSGGQQRILAGAELEQRARLPLARLSGGEAQRLYLAAATVHSPELVFLDEPTAHLDPQSRREAGQRLKALAQNCTVVMTTHDLREAELLFDEAVFLVAGQVKAQGSVAALSQGFEDLAEAFFHHCSVRIGPRGEQH
ncbi:MAG: ABC transporter ATP-binding protein [Candidatus Eremiobacteraeota bacterium]|nr:ABC transporter ATP-binding protein [Candidatus Eremiobacteraeota bacterium]